MSRLASGQHSLRRVRQLGRSVAALVLLSGLGDVTADQSNVREGYFSAPDLPALRAHATTDISSLAPGFYQTSEYMIGRVAVGVILPESTGGIDPNLNDWSAEQRNNVLNEVAAGLNWWTAQSPEANLSFVIDDHATIPVSTGYEPITRPQFEEGLWIGEVMAELGYRDGSYWTRVRAYANDLRTIHHADWAFAIFVVNSAHDADGAFADRYFAYAYIGGPFFVITYDNAGYAIDHMDAVAAHEAGHIFHALDKYPSANVACTARAGYLGIETQNSQQNGCASNVPSIMRGGIYPYLVNAIDVYARRQIGWSDLDNDRLYDPIDTQPSLTVDTASPAPGGWIYLGVAVDQPTPSPFRLPATINDVTVEYSLDGGAWQPATPVDGAFDSPSEEFALMIDLTASGNHRLALRARNRVGNISNTSRYYIIIPDPIDGGLDTWLEQPPAQLMRGGDTPTLRGTASSFAPDGTLGPAIRQVEYRIDGGMWQPAAPADNAFDSVEEDFTIAIDVGAGQHALEVRSIDAIGKVEQNAAGANIRVAYVEFIPIAMR